MYKVSPYQSYQKVQTHFFLNLVYKKIMLELQEILPNILDQKNPGIDSKHKFQLS